MGTSSKAGYELEFAIDSKNEFRALEILEEIFGKNVKREVAIRSVAKRNGLIFISHRFTKEELTDYNYRKLLAHRGVLLIINDELSAKRASKLLTTCIPVETLLKRLLIYVWSAIYVAVDKNGGKKAKIEVCNIIDRLYLGDLVKMLNVDLARTKRETLILEDGKALIEILQESEDFSDFKQKLAPYIEPHTVWEQINLILKKPVDYSNISKQVNKLKVLRDKAAHPQVILEADLKEAEKCARHIVSTIGVVKNDYYDEIQKVMKVFTEAMTGVINPLPKIQVTKAWTESISKLSNTLQESIAKSFNSETLRFNVNDFMMNTDWSKVGEEACKNDPGMKEIMDRFEQKGTSQAISEMADEISELAKKTENDALDV